MIDNILYSYMNEVVKNVPNNFHRYLYAQIEWDARMIGIVGPRGVGKSTMLLQRIAETQGDNKTLYVTADNTYFANHSLLELADAFVKDGGQCLYIDEIHRYQGWSRELKNMYDLHPALKIVYTGSSILDLLDGEADLSRRTLHYTLQGLSFREFLELYYNINTPIVSLDEILSHQVTIEGLEHPLPMFREYLSRGYYPFSKEPGFEQRMQQVVNQTVENDIPQYADMKVSTARKLKRLLTIIASSAPYKPNALNLATEIGVSKNNIPDYLLYLEKAGMIGQLRDDTGGFRSLGKVEKVYVDNPTLSSILAEGSVDVGNLRETFFYNQTRVKLPVVASKKSDFAIGNYTFEVGGKNKGKKQIIGIPNAYVVKDDIEYGSDNILPLFSFGLLY